VRSPNGGLGDVSAADIEHAILRAPMSKPSAFGASLLPKYPVSSPKRLYTLMKKEPLITFGLACGTILISLPFGFIAAMQ
jgi:hypothetical protein